LKSSGLKHWRAGYYNPGVQNYRWERSDTVGEVLCISAKLGNSDKYT